MRKMEQNMEHCMLLALPCGYDTTEMLEQSRVLKSAFIDYLVQKLAAGIVNVGPPVCHRLICLTLLNVYRTANRVSLCTFLPRATSPTVTFVWRRRRCFTRFSHETRRTC